MKSIYENLGGQIYRLCWWCSA